TGSHATYAMTRGPTTAPIVVMTSRPAPSRGGSSTTTSTSSGCANDNTAPTSPRTTVTVGRVARFARADSTAPASASTPTIRPAPAPAPSGATYGARVAANSPTPLYRSSTCSPARGS